MSYTAYYRTKQDGSWGLKSTWEIAGYAEGPWSPIDDYEYIPCVIEDGYRNEYINIYHAVTADDISIVNPDSYLHIREGGSISQETVGEFITIQVSAAQVDSGGALGPFSRIITLGGYDALLEFHIWGTIRADEYVLLGPTVVHPDAIVCNPSGVSGAGNYYCFFVPAWSSEIDPPAAYTIRNTLANVNINAAYTPLFPLPSLHVKPGVLIGGIPFTADPLYSTPDAIGYHRLPAAGVILNGVVSSVDVVLSHRGEGTWSIDFVVPGVAGDLLQIQYAYRDSGYALFKGYGLFRVDALTADVKVNTDKLADGTAQVVLAPSGLDAIAVTAPTGPAETFREMVVQTWRRFFRKATKDATTIKTYADDGETVVTTQTIAEASNAETQGAAT